MNSATPLDPLSFPLRGSQLIEASAGTGKTYTIAALYVRLVLGPVSPDQSTAFPRALLPPEILVVTFTEAATKELRERIRHRLTEAAEAFLKDAAPQDDFLKKLREAYDPSTWPACARRLQTAAEWMDEAAVSTIHGWCNRMLREHAFDSGALFSQRMEPDLADLLEEAVQDYWRVFMVPLPVELAEMVGQWYPYPAKLQQSVKDLISRAEELPETETPVELLIASIEARKRALTELKSAWLESIDHLKQALDSAFAAKAFNTTLLTQRKYGNWLSKLREWCADPESLESALKGTHHWKSLTKDAARELRNGVGPTAHTALAILEGMTQGLDLLPDGSAPLLCHAARWIAERFAAAQRQRALMGFDGLLTQLDDVLQGPSGQPLAKRIRAQFPVVLIDEFQDTDPVQYRLFDAVYRVQDNNSDTALILIGDPKQAIYSFRNADIYTYLTARQATAGRWHTLAQNFRSTDAMVQAVNTCFDTAEQRDTGHGAFLFRTDSANPVPFQCALAAGEVGELQISGETPPALHFWTLPLPDRGKAMSKDEARAQTAAAFASEITRLLNLGQQGHARIASKSASHPLKPADIAVLVNDGIEAEAMQKAMLERRVRSVYLSDRDSVYDSAEAADLQRWLAAVVEPEDGYLIRAALATATLALPWITLEALRQEDVAWETEFARFQNYRQLWQQRGVLPMLRRLLHDFKVPDRLLAQEGGERRLTNLLHLAELLQHAARLHDGERALIRFLALQRAGKSTASGGDDSRQVRLESDADRVQVVTVHKSKGLQYPLVFLPFANAARTVKPDQTFVRVHDAGGQPTICIPPSAECLVEAERDRLGEDLRKLYVALTRARYATWCGVAPTDTSPRSALAYLVGAGPDCLDLAPELERLAAGRSNIKVIRAPEANRTVFSEAESAPLHDGVRRLSHAVRDDWWIASYSAISGTGGGTGGHSNSSDTPREANLQELEAESHVRKARADEKTSPSPGTLHAFPRGAEAGTFLHDQLEWAARVGFARVLADPDGIRHRLTERCEIRDWQSWVTPLQDWLFTFLDAKLQLPHVSLRLADLDTAVPELEFWIAAERVSVNALDRLVHQQILPGQPRPALNALNVNGMLKGFIDLCFAWQGRYYVVDYKSNWLGPDAAAYTSSAMQAAVLNHRYDLQYVLYILALHRLLKARLADYDYERHVGGAVYVFLRGLAAPSQGLHFDRPPRVLIETLDEAFAGYAQLETEEVRA